MVPGYCREGTQGYHYITLYTILSGRIPSYLTLLVPQYTLGKELTLTFTLHPTWILYPLPDIVGKELRGPLTLYHCIPSGRNSGVTYGTGYITLGKELRGNPTLLYPPTYPLTLTKELDIVGKELRGKVYYPREGTQGPPYPLPLYITLGKELRGPGPGHIRRVNL